MKKFICTICGYVYTGEEAPESCPICGAPKESFEELKEKSLASDSVISSQETPHTKAWRCLNCEYIHEGDKPPKVCPVCGMSHEHFESYSVKTLTKVEGDIKKVLILGSGIAAYSAAQTLREIDDHVEITIVTNEERLPYYRLNLTRYLAGEIDEADLCIQRQYDYDSQRIQVYRNKVVSGINREAKTAHTFDGTVFDYDRLIIALGAHPFIPPIEGISQKGIYTLRSLDEANDILTDLKPNMKVLVIGGGVLGLETAGALGHKGIHPIVAEGAPWLMPRQLNEKASAYVQKSLERQGVSVAYDFRTKHIEHIGQGFKVVSDDGRELIVDRIIVATGVRPNTYLARMAELEVHKGLVVNDYMETSDPNIYAVGDVTEHYGVVYGLWNIAQYQGKIGALNLMGIRTPFGGVPMSNALKVLDVDVFSIGEIVAKDASYEILEHVDVEQYLMINVQDGVMVGAIAIGYKSVTHKIKKAVESGQHVSVKVIEDLRTLFEE